jgi:hypothetical protein
MAAFTYTGDETRVYPNITVDGAVLVAEAGKSYDLSVAPDEFWVSVSQAPQTPPEAPVSVAAPESDQTPSAEA